MTEYFADIMILYNDYYFCGISDGIDDVSTLFGGFSFTSPSLLDEHMGKP